MGYKAILVKATSLSRSLGVNEPLMLGNIYMQTPEVRTNAKALLHTSDTRKK